MDSLFLRSALPLLFMAGNANAVGLGNDLSEIQVPSKLMKKLKSFEPSGAVYLADLHSYLIVSDDTTKQDTPLLFLMNSRGEVERDPIEIGGIDRMTDMESISQDESGMLYITSSQGLNKKGKDLPERDLFVRARRDGRNVQATDSVFLRPLLLKALQGSADPILAGMRSRFEEELDIESSFVDAGELYVGLKDPQPEAGTAVLLNLGPVNALFEKEKIENLRVWKTIDFAAVSDDHDRISDMKKFGDDLLILTSVEGVHEGGHLWRFTPWNEKLEMLQTFDAKSEGLAIDSSRGEVLITFDEGDRPALFTTRKF